MAGDENPIPFLTEDATTEILLRLPTSVCIARFRCVCRSWRILLSDPQFIRKFLFFQNSDDLKSLRILFTGVEEEGTIYYSSHSYDDLRLISSGDLPCIPGKLRRRHPFNFSRSDIVGCCGGIFCISEPTADGGGVSDIILWNPTTSETKYLPVSGRPDPWRYGKEELTGFGFDPETNDYKVVRRVRLPYIDDGDSDSYTEVYRLRNNDSWKRLPDAHDLTMRVNDPRYIHQRDAFRNERCYWFLGGARNCVIVSFDMSEEKFEVESKSSDDLPYLVTRDSWYNTVSCYMLKGSFVTTLQYKYGANNAPMEVWALMKYGVAESWTKLFTFRSPLTISHYLEVWKDGAYICSPRIARRTTEGKSVVEYEGVHIFYPATEKIGYSLDIEGRTRPFQAHTYTSSLVSLLDLVI